MRYFHPCDNCGEVDDHECVIDGEIYAPWEVDEDDPEAVARP